MKPHIKRPTAEDISAILAPSYEYEKIELHKPAYDYLASCLNGSRAEVSSYVSNRITSELVRLSKMKDGTGGHPHKGPMPEETRKKHRIASAIYWFGRDRAPETVRVRVFDRPHKAFMSLSEPRSVSAGKLICGNIMTIDRDALAVYCKTHPGKPEKFVRIDKDSVEFVKRIASERSVPFTKIICYILERCR